jgi:hypothetical protein
VEEQILLDKLRRIDRRASELETQLSTRVPEAQRTEFEAEARALGAQRRIVENRLADLAPLDPVRAERAIKKRRRELEILRREVRSRIESTESFCARCDAAGDHREARIHRATILDIPMQICREYHLDPSLIAELDL